MQRRMAIARNPTSDSRFHIRGERETEMLMDSANRPDLVGNDIAILDRADAIRIRRRHPIHPLKAARKVAEDLSA